MRNYFFFKIESPLGTVTPARLPQQRAIHLPCPHKAHSSFYFKSLSDPFITFSVLWFGCPHRTFLFFCLSSWLFPAHPSLCIKGFPLQALSFLLFAPKSRKKFFLIQQTRPDPIVKERKHYTCHACLSATPFFLSHSNFSYLSNIERKYQVCLIPRNQRLVISEYEKSWGEAWLGCETSFFTFWK